MAFVVAITDALPGPSSAGLLAMAESNILAADLDGAKVQVMQAMAVAESLGDRHMLARASTLLVRVLLIRDEADKAMAAAMRAVELCQAVDDRTSMAKVHSFAARILLMVGETGAALEACLAALEASEGCNDLEATFAATRELTNVYGQLRQWDKALEFGERHCEIARQIGNLANESAAIDTISCIFGAMREDAVERGDSAGGNRYAAEAERRSRTAMQLARQAGSYLGEATCLANLAESLSDIGRHQEALDLLDTWHDDPHRMTATLSSHHAHTRGIVLMRLGRDPQAIVLLSRCLAQAPTRPLEITACRALAEAYERTGNLRAALDHHKRLLTLVSQQSSETARRAASVAAVRLETAQVHAQARRYEAQTTDLMLTNEQLSRSSADFQRQALEDPLTGLPNRRRFDELLDRDGLLFSIVMVDLDHFKRINDDHSHLVGDAVLRELGKLLRANCREGDMALRIGGEEFAVLLNSVSAERAMAAAERIRSGVLRHDWGALAPGLSVTASFGVAMVAEAATKFGLLALADRRMYEAKVGGRNRVVGPA
jgi:diguanylate cyclase (GGDEF)-like protein